MATATTTSTSVVSQSAQRRAPAVVAKPLKTPPLSVQLLTAGSAACVADIFTFPLDTAKVRLQVSNKHLINELKLGGGMQRISAV